MQYEEMPILTCFIVVSCCLHRQWLQKVTKVEKAKYFAKERYKKIKAGSSTQKTKPLDNVNIQYFYT